jgi:trehalose 6-phosphate phosphatase
MEAAVGPLRADPASAAVLLDLDGTLAPIVERPSDSAIPGRTGAALARVVCAYPLVAIVTGRRAAVARQIVGLDDIAYAGIHGFELLEPGAAESRPAPALQGVADRAPDFAERFDARALEAAGVRLEDKGPIVAMHWRGAADEAAAAARAEEIAPDAEAAGLVLHRGRKVIELRPPVEIDKGTAVEALLAGTHARTALYAGDDRTDLDAFAALARLVGDGRLDRAVRVGVASAEGPDEIALEADLLLGGTEALADLLEALVG